MHVVVGLVVLGVGLVMIGCAPSREPRRGMPKRVSAVPADRNEGPVAALPVAPGGGSRPSPILKCRVPDKLREDYHALVRAGVTEPLSRELIARVTSGLRRLD